MVTNHAVGTTWTQHSRVNVFLQRRRDGRAAKRFFKRLLRASGSEPRRVVTDKLRSYGVARPATVFLRIHVHSYRNISYKLVLCQKLLAFHYVWYFANLLDNRNTDNKEVRRLNLIWLRKRALKKSKEAGKWRVLAKKYGASKDYLQQVVSKKTVAYMGDKVARQIEAAENEARGWMDSPLFDEVATAMLQNIIDVRDGTADHGQLSPTESRILNMWRGWTPAVKQYVFGQMQIADYTKDVLAQMFIIRPEKAVTEQEVDEMIIDTVSETGEFKALSIEAIK